MTINFLIDNIFLTKVRNKWIWDSDLFLIKLRNRVPSLICTYKIMGFLESMRAILADIKLKQEDFWDANEFI